MGNNGGGKVLLGQRKHVRAFINLGEGIQSQDTKVAVKVLLVCNGHVRRNNSFVVFLL